MNEGSVTRPSNPRSLAVTFTFTFPVQIPLLDLKPATAELRAELDAAYRRVMDSGWFLLGPELEAFENEYAATVGVKHCVGVANGLEAMQLILMAQGIGRDDEVIVPSNGYIATWLAVTHAGATPVPCEPDPVTFNLDPARLAACITPRTRAVLPIHLYGHPANMGEINAIAGAHGLRVIEDAAQSHGARCRTPTRAGVLWGEAGALGHAAGVSFYPSKNLGALADAGAVTTDDGPLAEKIRVLRNYGTKERYRNEVAGHNSRLSELQAAFLRVKLRHLPEWNARRRALAAVYLTQLKDVPGVVLPTVAPWAEPVWHLFVVRAERRAALRDHLTAAGIGSQVHYPTPPHLSGAYQAAGWRRGAFPIAEALAEDVLSLPMSPHHSIAEIEKVCSVIRQFYAA